MCLSGLSPGANSLIRRYAGRAICHVPYQTVKGHVATPETGGTTPQVDVQPGRGRSGVWCMAVSHRVTAATKLIPPPHPAPPHPQLRFCHVQP